MSVSEPFTLCYTKCEAFCWFSRRSGKRSFSIFVEEKKLSVRRTQAFLSSLGWENLIKACRLHYIMDNFKKQLAELKKLNLPNDKYAVFGSGPLAIYGIRDSEDIDIIVKSEL